MTGIGGDCFVLYAPKGGMPIGLNGSGRAPQAATLDWYIQNNILSIEPERRTASPCGRGRRLVPTGRRSRHARDRRAAAAGDPGG